MPISIVDSLSLFLEFTGSDICTTCAVVCMNDTVLLCIDSLNVLEEWFCIETMLLDAEELTRLCTAGDNVGDGSIDATSYEPTKLSLVVKGVIDSELDGDNEDIESGMVVLVVMLKLVFVVLECKPESIVELKTGVVELFPNTVVILPIVLANSVVVELDIGLIVAFVGYVGCEVVVELNSDVILIPVVADPVFVVLVIGVIVAPIGYVGCVVVVELNTAGILLPFMANPKVVVLVIGLLLALLVVGYVGCVVVVDVITDVILVPAVANLVVVVFVIGVIVVFFGYVGCAVVVATASHFPSKFKIDNITEIANTST